MKSSPKLSNKTVQINKQKQCNFLGSTKTQNRSNSVESMDIESDSIITNLNLVDT